MATQRPGTPKNPVAEPRILTSSRVVEFEGKNVGGLLAQILEWTEGLEENVTLFSISFQHEDKSIVAHVAYEE